MEFVISRTSIWDYEYEDKTDDEIIEMMKLPQNLNIQFKEFVDIFGNKIKCPILKIDGLQELLDLENEVGQIIIRHSDYSKDFMEIEIYDDYRE